MSQLPLKPECNIINRCLSETQANVVRKFETSRQTVSRLLIDADKYTKAMNEKTCDKKSLRVNLALKLLET